MGDDIREMIVVNNSKGDLPQGITTNLNLEKYSEYSDYDVLFYGLNSTIDLSIQQQFQNYGRKVLLNLWSPCEWMSENLDGKDAFGQIEYFDEIYSICPYTIEWLREKVPHKRLKFIFHPHDDSTTIDRVKTHSVGYFGSFPSRQHEHMAATIAKFDNHILMSQQRCKFLTHHRVSHEDKMKVVGNLKISIIYNMLRLSEKNVENLKNYRNWEQNKAFYHAEQGCVPQYKARMNEAAYCKSLMLVIRDEWNVCEHFWTPDVDFFYTSFETLENDIRMCLDNYDNKKIKNMINSAYEKSFSYNAKSVYEMIKRGEECPTKKF